MGLPSSKEKNLLTISMKSRIKSIEAKLLKVRQDMETLEENRKGFHTIYKGIHKEHISKRRKKKENRRKPKKIK